MIVNAHFYSMLSMRGLVLLHGQRQRRLSYWRYSTRNGWEKPILRLIHALVDNDDREIKHAYLERFDVLSVSDSDHIVIGNRNTPETMAASCLWTDHHAWWGGQRDRRKVLRKRKKENHTYNTSRYFYLLTNDAYLPVDRP